MTGGRNVQKPPDPRKMLRDVFVLRHDLIRPSDVKMAINGIDQHRIILLVTRSKYRKNNVTQLF